jgi:hypothetical protein
LKSGLFSNSQPAAYDLLCPMDKFSEYRCMREAKKAPCELHRVRWLKLAQRCVDLSFVRLGGAPLVGKTQRPRTRGRLAPGEAVIAEYPS